MASQSLEAESIPKVMKGFLEIEDDELKFFTRRFFILKEKNKVLEYYRDDPFIETSAQKDGSIDIRNITKVGVSTQRPKTDNCFEICLTAKKYFLASCSHENMMDWVNALHKAAVNPRDRVQSDNSKNVSTPAAEDDNVGSHTSIIAGVVVKTNKSGDKQQSQTGGIKPLYEGWCSKQGAVMKSWKRRYFSLSVIKLCYFENKEDKEPIRSILTQDLKGVREMAGYSGRENVLEIETPYRKFYMQPEKREDLYAWKQAIENVRTSLGIK